MKNQTSRYFRLVSPEIAENCFKAINDFVEQANGKVATVIVAYENKSDKQRSKDQNALYWVWLTKLQHEWGQDKDSLHIGFKRRFLSRIYLRDGVDKKLPLAIKNLQVIAELAPHIYESQAEITADGIRSSLANTQQFREYLDDIYTFSYTKGIFLESPDELKWVME